MSRFTAPDTVWLGELLLKSWAIALVAHDAVLGTTVRPLCELSSDFPVAGSSLRTGQGVYGFIPWLYNFVFVIFFSAL